MNKKLVLSVLSTAVVASMASAAMAKPGAGFYVGGEVDKYYSIGAFFDNFDEALDNILDNMEATVFVDGNAQAAPFLAALEAEDINTVLKPATKADFENNPYAVVDGEEGQVYNPAEDDELPPPGEVPGELKVESVSAITSTTVDVAIAAPTEDVLGATVEVKDNNGNIVEVNPTDISAGDTVASFTFKTPVEKLEGVWTVDGKEYSFTAIQQLADITDAASANPLDQVKLLNALNAAGIQNVDENKLAAYAEAIVDAAPATLADVQTAVDNANKSATDKEAEAAAVKAVVDAENQIQLLNALKAGFAYVNADWTVKYQDAEVTTDGGSVSLINLTEANSAGVTFEGIQDAINGVNDVEVAAAYDTAFKSLKSADVTAARTLANTYLATDEEATITKKEWANDSLDVLDALIRVNTATTNNSLKTALVALDNLETTLVEKYKNNVDYSVEPEFDIKLVNDSFLADYRKAISEQTDVTKKNQRKDIDAIIKQVNGEKATTQLGSVKGATTADELLKALKAYPELKQVADINKDNYWTTDNGNFASVDADSIQAAVDAANLDAVANATASNIIAKLNVFGLDNVVAANAAAYVEAQADLGGVDVGATNAETVKNLKDAVEVVNKAVAEVSEVEAINKATTATEVKSALDNLAIASYVDVPRADKLYIAEKVLDARASQDDKKFANKAAVANALDTADTGIIAKYDALVGEFAYAKLTNISTTVSQLDKLGYDAFDNLSGGQKAEVAEFFKADYPKNDDGAVDYETLAAVKAAIDAAIAKVNGQ